MRPVVVSVGPLVAANATNIRTASAIAGAGAVVLNGTLVAGGVATLDKARRILFTSAGNDSGITFTVTGTDINGQVQTEILTGGNAVAVFTNTDFKTVTSVVASGAAAGNVSIGTNGVASSAWVRLDEWAAPQTAIQIDVSGVVNYTVQQTLDDPNSFTNPVLPSAVTWINSADVAMVNATTSLQSNYAYAPTFARVLLNSGAGSLTGTFIQFGVVGR